MPVNLEALTNLKAKNLTETGLVSCKVLTAVRSISCKVFLAERWRKKILILSKNNYFND